MGLGFLNGLLTVVFQIQRKSERLAILPFQCPLFGVPQTWFESLDGCRSRNIQIASMCFNLQIYIILWFLKPFISILLDLETSRDRYMYPKRSKAWEQSNPGFPTPMTQIFWATLDTQVMYNASNVGMYVQIKN